MALPIIIGIAAAIAAAAGAGAGTKGAVDLKNANDKMKNAKQRNDINLAKFQEQSELSKTAMEKLGELELRVNRDFIQFSDSFEKIKNRPEIAEHKQNAELPKFDFKAVRTVSVASGAFLGAAAGSAAGAVFGTAAAAGTTAAVMALGTASTGTAIATLSGAAATNAALAALGGGAIAAGGGGMALGSMILGGATLGIGFLVGGAIFAVAGATVKEKAGEAYAAMLKNEREIERTVSYLSRLGGTADKLRIAIEGAHKVYMKYVKEFIRLVDRERDWNAYDDAEQLLVENTILLVSVLHKMTNTPLIKVTKTDGLDRPLETGLDESGVRQVIASSADALGNISKEYNAI